MKPVLLLSFRSNLEQFRLGAKRINKIRKGLQNDFDNLLGMGWYRITYNSYPATFLSLNQDGTFF